MGNCQKETYEHTNSEISTGSGVYSFKKEVSLNNSNQFSKF